MSTGVSKIAAQRNQRILLELILKPGNDICADCKARAPRWASYNIGIFICMNCASIHRKIGTHITKVKSITMDEWNKEQIQVMKENGNIKSNGLYNPNEARHPPPTNMIDSERDSELERFIRSKYEFKRFMDRKASFTSQQLSADPWAASSRSHSTPLTDSAQSERRTSPGPPLPPKTPENLPPGLRYSATIPPLPYNAPPPIRSASQPLPPPIHSEKLSAVPPLRQPVPTQLWQDLISLQEPPQSSSLPLQYSPLASATPFSSQPQGPLGPLQQQPTPVSAPNPFRNLSLGQVHPTTPLVSIPGPQFPFVPTAPSSSPALHLGATNPFNQAFASPTASMNGTSFATSPNPFSSSPMPVSTTPSLHPVVALSARSLLQTQPPGYVPSQTPTLSFSPMLFSPAPTTAGLAQNPFTPIGTPGQVPLSGSVATNPFSVMQMGQAGFSGTIPPILIQQQQQQQQQQGSTHGFSTWAGQGVQGTF